MQSRTPFSRAERSTGATLQGNRVFALLMIRVMTYGPEYAFGIGCQADGAPRAS